MLFGELRCVAHLSAFPTEGLSEASEQLLLLLGDPVYWMPQATNQGQSGTSESESTVKLPKSRASMVARAPYRHARTAPFLTP